METVPIWRTALIVALGAVPGAITRYLVVLAWNRWLDSGFPWGTLTVNLVGAGAMGMALTWFMGASRANPEWQLWLLVGFLGSFTTFSSYILEIWGLLQGDRPWLGWLYGLGSMVLGLAFLHLGSLWVKFWSP